MLWAGRFVVMLIAVVALFIAMDPNSAGIMALVECAWGAFGASFGPVILLAIFWGAVYCLYRGLNDPFLYFRF
jgi:sodium/proline symporter